MGRAEPKRPRKTVKVRRPRKPPGRPLKLRALVGMFASGAGDLGRRHDDYLYGWKKPDA